MHLIRLKNVPILEQLRLEEALLRTDQREFCIVNHGSPPAIVLGISSKVEKMVHLPLVQRDKIPLIRRFSGGGTVYIDEETLFITFILNGAESTPREISQKAASLLTHHFSKEVAFRENDFVMGDKKVGGNAQYIQKGRWLHHTSFLWNFSTEKMGYLKLPEKRPAYRQSRPHEEFLTPLAPHFGCKEKWLDRFTLQLRSRSHSLLELQGVLQLPHRQATCLLNVHGFQQEQVHKLNLPAD